MLPGAIQNWLAERGYGQYALPRGRPRWRRMSKSEVILRLGAGTLGLCGLMAFGAMTIAIAFFLVAFVSAAFSGHVPTIR